MSGTAMLGVGGELAQVQASHILVKWSGSRRPSSWKEDKITRSKDEALAAIKALRQQVVDSGDVAGTFAALAKTESDCGSAAKGGDLGMFGRGQMQEAFENAAFGLHVGELSEPFFSDSGCHIVLRTA